MIVGTIISNADKFRHQAALHQFNGNFAVAWQKLWALAEELRM
jgi:hypothetical protein